MKVDYRTATAMKCLAGKLEIASKDPDPKALTELTEEYNCKGCSDVSICRKLFICVAR